MLAQSQSRWVLLFALAMIALGAGILAGSLVSGEPEGIVFGYDSALEPGSPIRVQVSGAVLSPGVYELRAGDRLVDALAAAGGPREDADTGGLNLARRVRDEERIAVPHRPGAASPLSPPGPLQPSGKLDINSATAPQLQALPAIGEAYARRIIDSRHVDGPYASIRDLVDRRVLPAGTFEQIRDLITAVQ